MIEGLAVCRSYVFFFSSRRRHTRFDCDWSSDVCSSDLIERGAAQVHERAVREHHLQTEDVRGGEPVLEAVGAPRILKYGDRKSTRLNSSHSQISYAVFCLKKKDAKLRQTLCHLKSPAKCFESRRRCLPNT